MIDTSSHRDSTFPSICRRRRFLSDIFNTMLDMKWRYVHLLFFFSFIGSWMAFAVIWKVAILLKPFRTLSLRCRYIIIYYHGDFEEDHLPERQEETGEDLILNLQLSRFLSISGSDRLDSLCLADK